MLFTNKFSHLLTVLSLDIPYVQSRRITLTTHVLPRLLAHVLAMASLYRKSIILLYAQTLQLNNLLHLR